MLPLECRFWIWQCEGRGRTRPGGTSKAPLPPPSARQVGLPHGVPVPTPLTQRAGRLVGESWRRWELWMRCLWTSSSAEGSVQKWSAVFILVYSNAQGPTAEQTALATLRPRKSALPSTPAWAPHATPLPSSQPGGPRVLLRRRHHKTLGARDGEQVSFDGETRRRGERPFGGAPGAKIRNLKEAQSDQTTHPIKTPGWGHPRGPSGALPFHSIC